MATTTKEFDTEHGHVTVELSEKNITAERNGKFVKVSTKGINVTDDNDKVLFFVGDFNLDSLTDTDIDLLMWEYYDNR